MRYIFALLFAVSLAFGQQIDLKSQSRNADFSTHAFIKPWVIGTSLPATCSVGSAFFDSDATAGQNVYVCTATNTWTLSSGSTGGLTASRALQSDGSGNVAVSSVTSTELGYLSGVTSAIQSQLNAKLSSTPPGSSGQFIYNNAGAFGAKTLANSDLPTSIDFTSKTATAPVKAGTSAPGTCVVSELFFDTDATAGLNMFGCTATDTWTLLGDGASGSGLADPGSNGVVVRTSSGVTTNRTITAGTGIAMANGDGVSGNPTVSINTATVSTTATLQSGVPFRCVPSSASGANYTCSMSPALGSYTDGMVVQFEPDVNSSAGAVTLNINSIASANIKQADGTTDPGAAALVAGRQIPLTYDGTVFRMPPSSSGLAASTPFSKAITIESPTSSEDITLFFTDDAITITQLNAVCVGSTPSVTYTIRHGSDRSATGNEVVTSGSTTTSTTMGDEVTSFNDATIAAGSWVWLETTAQSGTVGTVNITIEYTRD
jgi:hypothetical protein